MNQLCKIIAVTNLGLIVEISSDFEFMRDKFFFSANGLMHKDYAPSISCVISSYLCSSG